MKNNAKARRLLGLPHWVSNTQKVMILDIHPNKWRAVRTKRGNHVYGDL